MPLFALLRTASWPGRSGYGIFSSEFSLRCVPRVPRITLGGIVYGAEQLGADFLVLNSTLETELVSLRTLTEGLMYNPPVLTGPEGQESSVLKSKPSVEIENCLTVSDDTLSTAALTAPSGC